MKNKVQYHGIKVAPVKTAATDAANTIKAAILPKTGSIWKSRIYAPLKKDLKTQEHCIETS